MKRTYVPAVIALMLIYMASLLGFILPEQRGWYLSNVPLFVLINFVLLIAYHKNWKKEDAFYLLSIFGIGLLWEFMAVKMSWIYGSYQFGESFGSQLLGVSLLFPLFHTTVNYSTSSLSHKLPLKSSFARIGIGAVLSTALMACIFPLASSLGFWGSSASIFLFLGAYFIIALVFQYLFKLFDVDYKNPMPIYTYGGLLVFFVGLLSFLEY